MTGRKVLGGASQMTFCCPTRAVEADERASRDEGLSNLVFARARVARRAAIDTGAPPIELLNVRVAGSLRLHTDAGLPSGRVSRACGLLVAGATGLEPAV